MKIDLVRRIVLAFFVIALVVAAAALFQRRGAEEAARDARTPAEKAVDSFRTAILAGDREKAEEAYDALKRLGAAAITPAAKLLGEEDEDLRAHGAELLAELVEAIREQGPGAPAPPEVIESVPLLVSNLNDPNERVRSEAASALGWIGPHAAIAIRPLEKTLADPSQRVRDRGERALARIRTGALEPKARWRAGSRLDMGN